MRSSISKPAIAARAREAGFDAVGFARAMAPIGASEGLSNYLRHGYHGDMAWMETGAARRADPNVLWPEAKSVMAMRWKICRGASAA